MTGLEGAFADHDAFDDADDGYVATSTPFDAGVEATTDPPSFEVTVEVPSIETAAEGAVGDPVVNGWFETLELRLEDAYDVTRAADGAVTVERRPGTVRVVFSYEVGDPARGVDAAAALVDYVEGTYVQGVIPGYDYTDPVAGLLAEARQNAQAGDRGRR